MINSIGFLSRSISVESLKAFVPDVDIAASLEYLNIPVVDRSEVPCDDEIDESEEIMEEDVVIFCTPNEGDVSFLQFHIQNAECTNMFLHHDTFVFSTITDSQCIEINAAPYVAVSTFEKDIMVYDPLVRNPVMPQILLQGHQDSVLCLESHNGMLFSGSQDSTVAEWDVERREMRQQTKAAGAVSKLAMLENAVVYSVDRTLHLLDEKIEFEGEVERIRIRGNVMLVSDSNGTLRLYDPRNISAAVSEKKIHQDSITAIDFLGENVYTASLDERICVLDGTTLELRHTENTEEKLFSLRTHDSGFYVYGGESNELQLKTAWEHSG